MLKIDLKNVSAVSSANASPKSARLRSNQASPSNKFPELPQFPAPSFDYDKVKTLLQKPEKSFKDARQIFNQIQDFDFFAENLDLGPGSEEISINICKGLRYRHYEKGSQIYREREFSDGNIFLILSGEVSLENASTTVKSFEQVSKLMKRVSTTIRVEAIRTPDEFKGSQNVGKVIHSPHDSPEITKKHHHLDQHQLLINSLKLAETCTLTPANRKRRPSKQLQPKLTFAEQAEEIVKDIKTVGNHFGENALSGANRRTEDAIAYTDCEIIILASSLLNTVKEEFHEKMEAKFQFIVDHVPGLDDIQSYEILSSIVGLFELRKLTRGTPLTVEGASGFSFFLIKEGEFEVFKKTRSAVESYHGEDNELLEKLGAEKAADEQLKLFILTPGSFVGEEVVFQQYGAYEYTVKVSSTEAKVYEMDRAKFALRFPERIFKMLGDHHAEKMARNNLMFQEKLQFHFSRLTSSKKIRNKWQKNSLMTPGSPKFHIPIPKKPQVAFNLPLITNTSRINTLVPSEEDQTSKSTKRSLYETPKKSSISPQRGQDTSRIPENLPKYVETPEKFLELSTSRNILDSSIRFPESPNKHRRRQQASMQILTHKDVKNPGLENRLNRRDILDINSYKFVFNREEKVDQLHERRKKNIKLASIQLPKPKVVRSLNLDQEVVDKMIYANVLLKKPSAWIEKNPESVLWFQKSVSPKRQLNHANTLQLDASVMNDYMLSHMPSMTSLLRSDTLPEFCNESLEGDITKKSIKLDSPSANKTIFKMRKINAVFAGARSPKAAQSELLLK